MSPAWAPQGRPGGVCIQCPCPCTLRHSGRAQSTAMRPPSALGSGSCQRSATKTHQIYVSDLNTYQNKLQPISIQSHKMLSQYNALLLT